MSKDIYYEIHLLWRSFGLGIYLLIFYDVLRLFRQIVPHHSVCIGLEDIIYWIYAAVRLFALFFYENDGNLRGYAVFAFFAGMLLYDLTMSLILRKLLKKLKKSFKMKKKENTSR